MYASIFICIYIPVAGGITSDKNENKRTEEGLRLAAGTYQHVSGLAAKQIYKDMECKWPLRRTGVCCPNN